MIRGAVRGGIVTAGEVGMQRPGAPDGEVVVGVRPERLMPAGADDPRPGFDLAVGVVEPLGSEVIVHGSVAGASGPVTARLEAGARPAPGSSLRLVFDPAAAHVFDATTGAAITAA